MKGCRPALRCVIATTALFAMLSCGHPKGDDAPSAGTDWPDYGGGYAEDHYSTLDQINERTVGRLRLAWHHDLPTMISTVGAPLAVDGTLYVGLGFSVVQAFDAASGRKLWEYDPQVATVAGAKLQLAYGIRGIAYAQGRIFTGTQDGRLIALDARTGRKVWSVQTTEPGDVRYITGAPRICNGQVVIGHGGADFGPTRGYVTAYDAVSGSQRWRFFTVPGNPALGYENAAMRMAAKTWSGQWWRLGGGGTVWDSMTCDHELGRIYLGVGNGAPWNHQVRSPGGGDNLFLASIVALDAATGTYVWHYQQNPAETWDWTATQNMTLATLSIAGRLHRVLMQAPKNGVFYVLDRDKGTLISARPFARVNWLSGIDQRSGRPIETPAARPASGVGIVSPGTAGAHGWQPMAFSPRTGLVYIPTTELPGLYDFRNPKPFWRDAEGRIVSAFDRSIRTLPDAPMPPSPASAGSIQAWNPVTQRRVWSVPLRGAINGGVASTAGDIVFQGYADGRFTARSARTGRLLWSFDAQNGILGQPTVYSAGNRQFVSVVTGFGGTAGLLAQASAQFGWDFRAQRRRILTFALEGRDELTKPVTFHSAAPYSDPKFIVDPVKSRRGFATYASRCFMCHGINVIAGGAAPDLLASAVPGDPATFSSVVRDGALRDGGMPPFADLNDAELEELRHYIRRQAAVPARKR